MYSKNLFITIISLMSTGYIVGVDSDNNRKNEEKIKKAISQSFCTPWYKTRQQIKEAIEAGVSTVDIEEYEFGYFTPMCLALNNDDIDFVEYLLKKGSNPNFDIKRVHSTRPIFFARSVNAAELLRKYGADLTVMNEGSGIKGGMNLLHSSINCNTTNSSYDDLFDYYLMQGLDPHQLNHLQGNLWHSLIAISICYCPKECFLIRAKKLHDLGISPYQENARFCSAIQEIERQIQREEDFLKKIFLDDMRNNRTSPDYKMHQETIRKLEIFLEIMKDPQHPLLQQN